MKITEIIMTLEKLKSQHGDLNVKLNLYNRDTWNFDIEEIAEIEIKVVEDEKIVIISDC